MWLEATPRGRGRLVWQEHVLLVRGRAEPERPHRLGADRRATYVLPGPAVGIAVIQPIRRGRQGHAGEVVGHLVERGHRYLADPGGLGQALVDGRGAGPLDTGTWFVIAKICPSGDAPIGRGDVVVSTCAEPWCFVRAGSLCGMGFFFVTRSCVPASAAGRTAGTQPSVARSRARASAPGGVGDHESLSGRVRSTRHDAPHEGGTESRVS